MSAFYAQNPNGQSPPPLGVAYYTVDVTRAGRVIAFHVQINAKPPFSNRERVALLAGIHLPTDATETNINRNTCIVWAQPYPQEVDWCGLRRRNDAALYDDCTDASRANASLLVIGWAATSFEARIAGSAGQLRISGVVSTLILRCVELARGTPASAPDVSLSWSELAHHYPHGHRAGGRKPAARRAHRHPFRPPPPTISRRCGKPG